MTQFVSKEAGISFYNTGSVFTNIKAKLPRRFMNLSDWITALRTGVYEEPVEAFRKYKAEGRTDLAQNIKTSIDAFLCAGLCPDGRKESDRLENWTQLLMVDVDNHDAAWSESMEERLKEFRWIVAAHKSIGNGLRLFVRLPAFNRTYFKIWAKVALKRIDALVGYPHDPACDHLMRISVASYDEHAWCRADEETEVFPYTDEELQQIQREIDNIERREKDLFVTDEDYGKVKFSNVRNFTAEQIQEKIKAYMDLSPYVAHHHHDSLILGGAMARCEGFTTADVSEMALLIRRDYPAPGYDYDEVLRNLLHGFSRPALYHQALHCHKQLQQNADAEASDDYVSSEELIAECPYFSEEILNNLPTLITSLLLGVNNRQRDVLIASILTALSSVMANVKCHYRGKIYSANIAFCVVAPAGSGKGICLEAQRLIYPIQEEYDAMYNTALRAYKQKRREWAQERVKSLKEGRDFDVFSEPQPPVQIDFLTSDIMSLSRFIEEQYNSPHGMIMFVSELAEYNQIEKADYGRLTATHRKVMMNETISKNFQSCGMMRVPFPKSSYIFAGTDEDFVQFIRSVEDGTLSRMAILTGASEVHWEELDADKHNREVEKELDKRYAAAGQTVLELFHYLQDHPTDIYIPLDMYDEVNTFFGYSVDALKRVGRLELNSLVNRAALLCLRIGAILTCIRKFETRSTVTEMDISTDDLRTAIGMTQVFLRHAAQYSTILPKSNVVREVMQPLDLTHGIFDQLPECFTSKEAIDQFAERGIRRTSAFQFLKRWKTEGLIENQGKGHYVKLTPATSTGKADGEAELKCEAEPKCEAEAGCENQSAESKVDSAMGLDAASGTESRVE